MPSGSSPRLVRIVDRSTDRALADGTIRRFPNRDDFVRCLIDLGEIQSLEDLIERRPELIAEIMHHWVAAGQTGCRFAKRLASMPDEARWLTAIFPWQHPPSDFAEYASRLCAGTQPEFELVQLTFPRIETPEDVCRIVDSLCTEPTWRSHVSDTNDGYADLALRWVLPDDAHVSWALGFAPFPSMPFTRRAPFTSIVLRNRPPGFEPPDPKVDEGRLAVHLAHVPDLLESEEERAAYWRTSQRDRAELLGDEATTSAKAKVTFRVPRHLAAQRL